MSKFKVGDRVKIIGPSICGYGDRIGEVTVVERGPECGNYYVKMNNESGFVFPPESLELVNKVPGLITERQIDIKCDGTPDIVTVNGVKYVREKPTLVSPLLDASRAGIGIGFSFNGVKQDFIVQNYEHDYETDSDIATIKSITRPRKVGA